MHLKTDFKEFAELLNVAGVEHVVVGAQHAEVCVDDQAGIVATFAYRS